MMTLKNWLQRLWNSFGFSIPTTNRRRSNRAHTAIPVEIGVLEPRYLLSNHAPIGTSTTVTVAENTPYVFHAANFGFSDPNDTPANSLSAVQITTLPTAGSLKDKGVAVTTGQLVSVADINAGSLVFTPAANVSANGYASFTFQVQDNGGTLNGGINLDPNPKTLTINVSNLPSVAGSETRANTITANDQKSASVASDANGNYVVAWQSNGQDGSGWGVYAQRYNAAGVAQGAEFRVNTTTTGDQLNPKVAMDAAGDFVIIWSDASQHAVFGQRYASGGTATGTQFRVTTANSDGSPPTVAMDAMGDFVVAWNQLYLEPQSGNSYYGVYAQRYSRSGAAIGTNFQVDQGGSLEDYNPSVAMDAAGDFTIAWDGNANTLTYGIYAQQFNAAGAALGTLIQVAASSQRHPSVAMDASGDFVVAWEGHDSSGYGVFAQRYTAAGSVSGSNFSVNTYTLGNQRMPSAAMDAAGDFTISWQSAIQDGSGNGVYAKSYTSTGVAQTGEFRVNSYTVGDQQAPAVAMNAAGNIIAAWESNGEDGSGIGVYAQRYSVTPASPPAIATVANQYSSEGASINLPVVATEAGGATFSYVATGLPAGLTINSQTGTITGVIALGAAAQGGYSARVSATDQRGTTVSTSFVWTVSAQGPVVRTITGQTSTEGATPSLSVVAVDPAGYSLTYAATGLPNGLTMNAQTGVISGIVALGDAANGPYNVQVTVSNSRGAVTSSSFT